MLGGRPVLPPREPFDECFWEWDPGRPSQSCASAMRAPDLAAPQPAADVYVCVCVVCPRGRVLSCPDWRLERLGSQQFAGPRAGRLGRGAEDREGSPRLRSPRSNPFGFCFGFARAARALTCSNPFCGRGRPGLFKALSAPAPWAFLKRPDRSRAELAGAGLRGVLPSRQRYGVAGSSGFPSERRAPGNARDAATEAEPGGGAGRRRWRRGRRLDGKFMLTAESTSGFQGEGRRARPGCG